MKLVPVHLDAPRVEVKDARGLEAQFALANGGGIAYGEIHLDPASRSWLLNNLPAIDDELTRGSAWVTLWDALLTGDVSADQFLSLAIRALPLEKTELNVSRILSYTRGAYWQYLPQKARLRLAPRTGGRAAPGHRVGADARA